MPRPYSGMGGARSYFLKLSFKLTERLNTR